jgi:hypothetical protein
LQSSRSAERRSAGIGDFIADHAKKSGAIRSRSSGIIAEIPTRGARCPVHLVAGGLDEFLAIEFH